MLSGGPCHNRDHTHSYSLLVNILPVTANGLCVDYALSHTCPRGPRCDQYHWSRRDEAVLERTGVLPLYADAKKQTRILRNTDDLKRALPWPLWQRFEELCAHSVFTRRDFDDGDVLAALSGLVVSQIRDMCIVLGGSTTRPQDVRDFLLSELRALTPGKPASSSAAAEAAGANLVALLWRHKGHRHFVTDDFAAAHLDLLESMPTAAITAAAGVVWTDAPPSGTGHSEWLMQWLSDIKGYQPKRSFSRSLSRSLSPPSHPLSSDTHTYRHSVSRSRSRSPRGRGPTAAAAPRGRSPPRSGTGSPRPLWSAGGIFF